MKKKFFFAVLIFFTIVVLTGMLMVERGRRNEEEMPFTMPRTTPPSTTDRVRQCKAIKNDKTRCRITTKFSNGYCSMHQALYNNEVIH